VGTAARLSAFEKPVYIIHHIVIIALPYYMATQHDRFTILPLLPYWFGWVRTVPPAMRPASPTGMLTRAYSP